MAPGWLLLRGFQVTDHIAIDARFHNIRRCAESALSSSSLISRYLNRASSR
jgi:hypothetical protein